ncbi:MAG: hypothetical protein V3R53_02210, partial [Gammaproteobacteria bacterium]
RVRSRRLTIIFGSRNLNVCFSRKRSFKINEKQHFDWPLTAKSGRSGGLQSTAIASPAWECVSGAGVEYLSIDVESGPA